MTTISTKSCIAEINAAPLPQRTAREQRIHEIATLTREIARAQKEADYYKSIGKPYQVHLDFIRRKMAERDRLMLQTDDGASLDPKDPEVVRLLGTLESRAEVETLILSFDAPEFTAPLPEGMPETDAPSGEYF